MRVRKGTRVSNAPGWVGGSKTTEGHLPSSRARLDARSCVTCERAQREVHIRRRVLRVNKTAQLSEACAACVWVCRFRAFQNGTPPAFTFRNATKESITRMGENACPKEGTRVSNAPRVGPTAGWDGWEQRTRDCDVNCEERRERGPQQRSRRRAGTGKASWWGTPWNPRAKSEVCIHGKGARNIGTAAAAFVVLLAFLALGGVAALLAPQRARFSPS